MEDMINGEQMAACPLYLAGLSPNKPHKLHLLWEVEAGCFGNKAAVKGGLGSQTGFMFKISLK